MTVARPFLDRLAENVRVVDECWEWQRALDKDGYGLVKVDGRIRRLHRYVYEFLVEPIPADLHIDHLCRNHVCCNPDHLEPVTSRENMLRGESPSARGRREGRCKNGHPLIARGDRLICLPCRAAATRRWKEQRRPIRHAAPSLSSSSSGGGAA